MATRQYIGARYVPKFYQNSVDGSASWQSNVVYDPLTYVTLTNGHMYISKKQVPATVGTPASNAEYWLDVGSYNGFIDDLQNQINALDAIIEKIPQGRKYVLIGDSFGCGIRGGGLSWVTGWIDYMNLKLPNQCFYYDPAGDQSFEGVSAFTSSSEKNFIGQLNYVYNNKLGTVDPEEITDIVVLGGTNEVSGSTEASIAAAIDTFCARAKTLFPNAVVNIGGLGLNARAMMKNNVYKGYRTGAQRNGAGFFSELFNLGTNRTYDSGYGHWSEAGYNYYNPIIAAKIISGETHFEWVDKYTLTVNTNDVAVSKSGSITYELWVRCTEKGVGLRVVDNFRGRGWDLNNVKAYSGSGTLWVNALTFTGAFYPAIVNGNYIDNSVVLYNNNRHTFDTASAEMTLDLDLGGNTQSHCVDIASIPAAIYDNAQQIAYSWNGTKYMEALIE